MCTRVHVRVHARVTCVVLRMCLAFSMCGLSICFCKDNELSKNGGERGISPRSTLLQ